MATAPATHDETLEQCVNRLLETWREETAFLSSSSKMAEHPAYRELIALGSPALPALFRDLATTSDGHLAAALSEITGAQPVEPSDRGSIRKVAGVWLRWARESGIWMLESSTPHLSEIEYSAS